MQRAKSVDEYIDNAKYWQAELRALRDILRTCALEETVKWGGPCYTVDDKNVVGLGAFKSYVGLWFHQGALLADPDKVLINAQQGRTRAMRQWRFAHTSDIKRARIKKYVAEAIALQKAGRQIKAERHKTLQVPAELQRALDIDVEAGAAFASLTPGKQREYADYVSAAKRDATKASRVAKILPMIAAGHGLNDRYR